MPSKRQYRTEDRANFTKSWSSESQDGIELKVYIEHGFCEEFSVKDIVRKYPQFIAYNPKTIYNAVFRLRKRMRKNQEFPVNLPSKIIYKAGDKVDITQSWSSQSQDGFELKVYIEHGFCEGFNMKDLIGKYPQFIVYNNKTIYNAVFRLRKKLKKNMETKTDFHKASLTNCGQEHYIENIVAQKPPMDNKRKAEEVNTEKEIKHLDVFGVDCSLPQKIPIVNKRKYDRVDTEEGNDHQDVFDTKRVLKKREEIIKQKQEAIIIQRNLRIAGEVWDLKINSPESIAGADATLQIGKWPPTGCSDGSCIYMNDPDSPAFSYGNLHEFFESSSEKDEEMKFVTKWKVLERCYTGTLRVTVQPSDRSNVGITKGQIDELMVIGEFDSGADDGVRQWSFKGYPI